MKSSVVIQRMLMFVLCSVLCAALPVKTGAREHGSNFRERRENGRDPRDDFTEDAAQIINWRKLDLSQEQAEQLKSLRREFQVATASVRKELASAEEALQTEISQDAIDREKIDRLVQEISGLKQRLSEAATENLLDLKDVLEPEQRERLAASQHRLPNELRMLLLTEEQKAEIRKLFKKVLRQNRALSNELRGLKGELRDLLLSPDETDETLLKELQAQIAAKELEFERAKVEYLLALRDILTPEQRKMLEKK